MVYSEPPKVIIFDFGGVIGGTDEQEVGRVLSSMLDISPEETSALMKDLSSVKKQKIPLSTFWKGYQAHSSIVFPDDWDEQFLVIKRLAIKANPQMLSLVESLKKKGYKVVLLSNVTKERAAHIRQLGIYNYFDRVFLSCDMEIRKPDKRIYKILFKDMNVRPEECLFIDNKEKNLLAAQDLGCDVICFTSYSDLVDSLHQRGI